MSVSYSPLRYPGGKARLYDWVARIIEDNNCAEKTYVEPYAGGAGLALRLLIHENVWNIHINDLDPAIFALWQAVLESTDQLCSKIMDAELTLDEWDRQRSIYTDQANHDPLEVAFATLFLNRTNRSGIIHSGGMIGGRAQASKWNIDARYNREGLVRRVELIKEHGDRISISNVDAMDLLDSTVPQDSRFGAFFGFQWDS